MSLSPLIEIENATVYRGSTRVLHEFSLTINQGEQVAIVGPNGAGKSTLLKLINRELYPLHNECSRVRILGRKAWNVWDLRAHIGLVSSDLQDRYPRRITAEGVVLSGFFSSIGTHGMLREEVTAEQRERAHQALTEFGVAEFRHTPLAHLSTGQQRRCLLARAMVHRPHTLILDEPAAGLDLTASFDYFRRVRQMIAEGRSIVLVTHHLNEIPPEIERVVLLRAGEVVADGAKSTVLTVDNLQKTFAVRVQLREHDGYYFTFPA